MDSPASSISSQSPSAARAEQMVQNFYTKFAQIVVQSRHGSAKMKINKWFNLAMEDLESLRSELKFWKAQAVSTPQPMILEVYLDLSGIDLFQHSLTLNSKTIDLEKLKTMDDSGGMLPKTSILLETWHLQVCQQSVIPVPLADLPGIYKKCVMFFRTLYSYTKLLPAYNLWSKLKTNKEKLRIGYRMSTSKVTPSHEVPLHQPLSNLPNEMRHAIDEHNFGTVPSPFGIFSLHLLYRTACDFSTQNNGRQDAIDITKQKSLDRCSSLSRHQSLSLSSSLTNRPYILPKGRTDGPEVSRESPLSTGTTRSPYISMTTNKEYYSGAEISPANANSHDIQQSPFSSNLSFGGRKIISTEHLFPLDFDLSNPPFTIDNSKKQDSETVSISSRTSETRTAPSLILRTTHVFPQLTPSNAPSTSSSSYNQAYLMSTTPPLPKVFTPSTSFGIVHPSQSLFMGTSPPTFYDESRQFSDKSGNEEVLSFIENINEKRKQRNMSMNSISSGLSNIEQSGNSMHGLNTESMSLSKQIKKQQSMALLNKFYGLKDINASFSDSLKLQTTPDFEERNTGDVGAGAMASSLPRLSVNEETPRPRFTTYPTTQYRNEWREPQLKSGEEDHPYEEDGTPDMIFDIGL